MLLPLLFPLCLSFIIAAQGMCMKRLRTTLGSGSMGRQCENVAQSGQHGNSTGTERRNGP